MITSGIGALFSLIVFIVYIGSVIWAFSDAQQRGKSGCLVALLVLLLVWPVGLIIWLLIRPGSRA
ncbi:MAG: hypothetical protein HUU46_09645 [Candidatus Hydrogenedentes bacterium]|nr:hypothetical protein [Candidatus Hydrogenedentota bacterium]